MGAAPDRAGLLRETLLFDWTKWNATVAWRSTPAMALALGVGIAAGSPGAGLVAAAGAFTTGLGSLQRIRGSCLIPMLLAAVGMALSTFVGMTLGHQSLWFVGLAAVWAASYALLTVMRGGTSWVAQQWAVWFLVSGAFHTSPRGAMMRSGLILAGGLFQTLVAAVLQWWSHRDGESAASEREPGFLESLGDPRSCLSLRSPVCRYALRMAVVITAAAEFYRHAGMLSGYWVPMTTLLVVRADLYQTLTRGAMRVTGTIVGAGLAGLIAAHLRPSPWILAAGVLFFAWWALAVLNVNYSLFTLNLTAYVVFLLALSGLPPAEVVHRRALYTLLGGALALAAYADVFWKTRRWIRTLWGQNGEEEMAA
jgi:hypothetical protein